MTASPVSYARVYIDGQEFDATVLEAASAAESSTATAPASIAKIETKLTMLAGHFERFMSRLRERAEKAAKKRRKRTWQLVKQGPNRYEMECLVRLFPDLGYRVADKLPRGFRQNTRKGPPVVWLLRTELRFFEMTNAGEHR